jgi:hypothetical protein
MASVGIRPLGDKVLIKRVEAEAMTAGGIVLPESAKEKPKRGTVLSLGDGTLLDTGERTRPGRQGHPRPLGPQRRHREVLRLPDRHQGRRHRRQGDRARRPYENMGAQMVKEVASKTSDVAGDGTTTATVYAEAIFKRA